MTSTLTTAPKPPEQTKLLSRHSYWAGMALRAEYDGASYLLYFHRDQELKVKTVFVRFFDPPDEETKEAAWAGSSRFSEAQSFHHDLPGYTECHDDENLSGYLVQDCPELVGRTGCMLTFCPNGFNGLRDLDVVRCDLLGSTTSYAIDNLAATVLREYLHWDHLTTGGISNMGGPPLIQDWNDPPVDGVDPTRRAVQQHTYQSALRTSWAGNEWPRLPQPLPWLGKPCVVCHGGVFQVGVSRARRWLQ